MADAKTAWNPKDFLQLHDIALWESSLKRMTEYEEGRHKDRMRVQTRRHRTAQVLEVLDSEENKAVYFRGIITFAARAVLVATTDPNVTIDPDISAEDVLFEIDASFSALYKVLQPIADEDLDSFLDFNCVHNVWPFWRQHVYDTLKRASLPVIEVPFFAGRDN